MVMLLDVLELSTMVGSSARGPNIPLVLTSEERVILERLANRPKASQALALRVRIVLSRGEDSAYQ